MELERLAAVKHGDWELVIFGEGAEF